MLQVKDICKQYKTGNLVQQALDHVSLSFRDSEFVAILGPSGSGKTTLLNVIGGLDRYDSGDLVINGVSTSRYTDRDWDTYRNHTVGFIFQSYNLIPHQSILSNVELTLTVSGVPRAERRRRAVEALEKVGLGKHMNKRPNQLSGGQMQRVAIARALVNDPDILLADEPTGALDSETSVQVMELLKEVARDRLVIMVTHNPELANEYATRIVRLSDGRIRADSSPYTPPETPSAHKKWARRSSMSFLTAFALSFQNLRSKKARTLLTAFAGSIGIIGIALILSLSNGVNRYIETVEEDTLSEYPLQIQSSGMDLSAMMAGMMDAEQGQEKHDVGVADMITQTFSKIGSNDLASLKEYLESGQSGIEEYTSAVEYSYSVTPQIYLWKDGSYRKVNPDESFAPLGLGSSNTSNSMMASMVSTNVFYQMPEDSSLYEDQYEIKAGRWPENENECVVVLTSGGDISDFLLYTLGLRDGAELDAMVEQFAAEEAVDVPNGITGYAYEDILGITFKLVNAADYYSYDEQYGVWTDKSDNVSFMQQFVQQGEDLTIVGIVQPVDGSMAAMLSPGINYTAGLTQHVMRQAAESEIVRQQIEKPDVNVFTGDPFGQESEEGRLGLEEMFSVDEAALENAFSVDTGSLEEAIAGLFDFSNLKLDSSAMGDLDLSGLKLDLSGLMDGIQINATPEQMQALADALLAGYAEYAAGNPQADFTRLDEYFVQYLQSDEAKALLGQALGELLSESGLDVSAEQLQQLVADVMAGYGNWAIENGNTDPAKFEQYLQEYLATDEAQEILGQGAADIISSAMDAQLTQEQLSKLAGTVLSGYQAYAAEHGLADPAKIGDYFMEYLQTEEARRTLSAALAGMVDTGGMAQVMQQAMAGALNQLMPQIAEKLATAVSSALQTQLSQNMNQSGEKLQQAFQDAFHVDADAFSGAIQVNMTEEELSEVLMSLMTASSSSYDGNLQALGYADPAEPSAISIYPLDFEAKEQVLAILDGYNARMQQSGQEEKVITYTDMVGTLMSSVTDIINVISYVLVAFVAISLIVSSIMIGVITYISVLERKKEIGILRAIGASKGNISQVFNAETFIIGLCAGLIGIGITLLLLVPGNHIIHQIANSTDVSAVLPAGAAVILVALSVLLTLLGGLIPSKKAARQDPVTALRTE